MIIESMTMKGNKLPSMINDIDASKVDYIADRLVDKFHSPDSREFYCLVAWKLPQATIDRLVVTATEKGKNPGKLFNYLARKEIS